MQMLLELSQGTKFHFDFNVKSLNCHSSSEVVVSSIQYFHSLIMKLTIDSKI